MNPLQDTWTVGSHKDTNNNEISLCVDQFLFEGTDYDPILKLFAVVQIRTVGIYDSNIVIQYTLIAKRTCCIYPKLTKVYLL